MLHRATVCRSTRALTGRSHCCKVGIFLKRMPASAALTRAHSLWNRSSHADSTASTMELSLQAAADLDFAESGMTRIGVSAPRSFFRLLDLRVSADCGVER
jgi:hypothetical protein